MHFTLRISPSNKPEFIISVSKKVAKKAVTRNLIKRRIKPILKNMSALKPAKYFIMAKPGAANIKGQELENELKSLVVGRKL